MKILKKVLLYFNTAKYLKPSQIFWKLLYRFRSFLFDKSLLPRWIFLGKAPGEFYGKVPETKTDFLLDDTVDTGELKDGKLTFLNETKKFTGSIDWRDENMDKLWNYNLHYFDYLPVLAHEGAQGDESSLEIMDYFIVNWIQNNPPVEGSGWEPYPMSLRIVNWIKATIILSGENVADEFYESLYKQTSFLNKSVEYHNLGNHIIKNGKALLFAGVFFGREKWRQKGFKILDNQLEEQILDDGGHCERTPMYHSIVLKDYLDVINLIGKIDEWEEKIHRMVGFLDSILHPDGEISLFNDSAFGIAPEPPELIDYYRHLTGNDFDTVPVVFSYGDSGYYGITKDNSKLIIDCGKGGADYQPAHVHCDLLSYELSVGGNRLVVDSGVYDYNDEDMRDYVRSNRAHNTFAGDFEQHEFWSVFRIGRRSTPGKAGCRYKNGIYHFFGEYFPWQGKEKYKRSIIYHPKNFLLVKDYMDPDSPLESYLHISPEISDVNRRSGKVEFLFGDREVNISLLSQGRLRTGFGWYCPEFGKRIKNTLVTFKNGDEESNIVYALNFTENEIVFEDGNIRAGERMFEFFEL